MTTVELDPAPGRDPEALIKEARRRQRRRHLAAGLAGLAGAGIVAGILLGGAGQSRHQGAQRPRVSPGHRAPPAKAPPPAPPIPASTGTAVLLWPAWIPGGGPPTVLDDLTTGKLAATARPAISEGDFQPLLITVGRYFVYVGDGTMAIRGDLQGRPRVLAKTPFFAPSAVPDHVWLVWPGDLQSPAGSRPVARLASVAGGPLGPPVTLPPGTQLIRGTDGGLLLQSLSDHGPGLELWNPGSAPRALPFSSNPADGFGASARLVEYATGCVSGNGSAASGAYDACRMLRIYDVVTGMARSFRAPPGTAGWVPPEFNLEQPISPGNAAVAAEAALSSAHHDLGRLYIVRLNSRHPRARVVPRSSSFVRMRVAWSVRGGWVLFQGPGRYMWAYQPLTGSLRASRTPCCQYTVMATIRAGPG